MANRRMFSRRVVSSARFLKMPPSTRALFFHLGLEADDDGIVEAYNVIRMIGATEDDLKLLVAKKFVIVLNDDLVSYISDWREHNNIRADRKINSIYQDLLLQIVPEVKLLESRERSDSKKKSVTAHENKGRPEDSPWTADGQHRLGKVRLGKDKYLNTYVLENKKIEETPKKIGESSELKGKRHSNNNTYDEKTKDLFDYWNSLIISNKLMTRGKKFTQEVEKIINARLKEHELEDLKKMLYKLSNNKHYLGNNNTETVYFCKHKTVFNKSKCGDRIENLDTKPFVAKEKKPNKFQNFKSNFSKYTNDELEKMLKIKNKEKETEETEKD